MNIKEAVEYVGKRFVYEADPKVIGDTWHVLPLKDDKFTGDCDDFAMTSLWYISDQKWTRFLYHLLITHKYEIYRCKTVNDGWHIISCVDDLWFDNWTRRALPKDEFFARTKHKIKMRYFSPIIIWFLIVGLFK